MPFDLGHRLGVGERDVEHREELRSGEPEGVFGKELAGTDPACNQET